MGAVDFGYLEGFAAGDAGVVREVLDLFLAQAKVWDAGLAAPDPAGLRDLAHNIKGTARGVGAGPHAVFRRKAQGGLPLPQRVRGFRAGRRPAGDEDLPRARNRKARGRPWQRRVVAHDDPDLNPRQRLRDRRELRDFARFLRRYRPAPAQPREAAAIVGRLRPPEESEAGHDNNRLQESKP